MPDESTWSEFFDPVDVLQRLGFDARAKTIVEFGCGYGTFTIPAATFGGLVVALDIDPEMVSLVSAKTSALGLSHVRPQVRDFVELGTGLPEATVDYAMLFNILHAQEAPAMLREAWRVLAHGGILAIMHWNFDSKTPRGPSMTIRPKPERLQIMAMDAGFQPASPLIDLPPYHYGFILRKVARYAGETLTPGVTP